MFWVLMMPESTDTTYRRTLDYGVFAVLVVVFAIAMLRRVRRPVEVDTVLSTPVVVGQAEHPDGGRPEARLGEAPSSESIGLKIDPNVASWWELAELPGIGETKARAIISFREQVRGDYQAEHPGAESPPAFARPEDLEAVPGIGQVTVEKMRPMLSFEPESAETTHN